MTAAQDEARAIVVGTMEFDHPHMIRARRMWAEVIRRKGVLAEGDEELVKYFQVHSIRDRLMADVVDPYVWDRDEYFAVFRGGVTPTVDMLIRMKHATEACRNLSQLAAEADLPPMLMVSSMIQWLVCNSGMARDGARIALRIDPQFELAQLMITLTDRGIQPDWIKGLIN